MLRAGHTRQKRRFFYRQEGGAKQHPTNYFQSGSLHGVGADGVGVKFPIFAVNFAVVCPWALSFRRRREKRRKTKKSEKKAKKCVEKRKMRKKGENHSDPIYTNPIKNLPIQLNLLSLTLRRQNPGASLGTSKETKTPFSAPSHPTF